MVKLCSNIFFMVFWLNIFLVKGKINIHWHWIREILVPTLAPCVLVLLFIHRFFLCLFLLCAMCFLLIQYELVDGPACSWFFVPSQGYYMTKPSIWFGGIWDRKGEERMAALFTAGGNTNFMWSLWHLNKMPQRPHETLLPRRVVYSCFILYFFAYTVKSDEVCRLHNPAGLTVRWPTWRCGALKRSFTLKTLELRVDCVKTSHLIFPYKSSAQLWM